MHRITITKKGDKMETIYSYNEMKLIFGKNNKQVKDIKAFLILINPKEPEFSKIAFRRIN